MILTCPACDTRYHVDPASLSPEGRNVRCAHCGHRWLARPPDDAPQAFELITPTTATTPRSRVLTRNKVPHRGPVNLVGWLLAVLVILVLASAVIGRNEIVAVLPASASIYQKLGLPVTVRLGLEFENVTSRRLAERGISILVVEGEIVNKSQEMREVPGVRITLLDDGGRQLQHQVFEAETPNVAAGASTAFSGRVVNPAEQARNFSVTFDLQNERTF